MTARSQSDMIALSQATSAPRDTEAAARTSRPIGVLVVDDHPVVRLGVRKLIDDQPDMRVVAEAGGADGALRELAAPIDVAIVDFDLGDGQDGAWLTSRLKRRLSPPRVLLYPAFTDGALAVIALVAGADGLLGKHERGQELCRAVRRLARGQHRLPAVTTSVAEMMASRLAARDRAVFGLLLHGTLPDVIAQRLGIDREEVHSRHSNILHTLVSALPRAGVVPARAPLDYQRPKRRRSGWAA